MVNRGTKTKQQIPANKIKLAKDFEGWAMCMGSLADSLFTSSLEGFSFFCFKISERHAKLTIKQTNAGINSSFIILRADTSPPIHNIVVVTSPIGVHAPPALAAITTPPPISNLSSGSFVNLVKSVIITTVVVKLSRIADKKKDTNPIIH